MGSDWLIENFQREAFMLRTSDLLVKDFLSLPRRGFVVALRIVIERSWCLRKLSRNRCLTHNPTSRGYGMH